MRGTLHKKIWIFLKDATCCSTWFLINRTDLQGKTETTSCWLTDLFTSLSKTPSFDVNFLKFVQNLVPKKSLHPMVDICLSGAVIQILQHLSPGKLSYKVGLTSTLPRDDLDPDPDVDSRFFFFYNHWEISL